jgi:hypothetical protein
MSYVACPALQYFSTLSHKRRDFRKKVLNTKCGFRVSTTFPWNIFHPRKKWARYDQKLILVFMKSALYPCPILMKLEFSLQIFEKYSNIKFHENLSCGSRVVPCEQTDGWTDMTKLIAAFRIFENAPKNRQLTHSTQPSWSHNANLEAGQQTSNKTQPPKSSQTDRQTDRCSHPKTTRR